MNIKHVHDTITTMVAHAARQGGTADAPSGEVRLARGHLHARRPRSYPRVWAFNALTPQDARHDLTRLGITPRHCSTDSPGRPSLPLYNTV
jgi:hypothetical protein